MLIFTMMLLFLEMIEIDYKILQKTVSQSNGTFLFHIPSQTI